MWDLNWSQISFILFHHKINAAYKYVYCDPIVPISLPSNPKS